MKPDDEFAGQGGRYEMREGKRVRIEESTQDHPEGNTARDKDGRPIVHATSDQIAAREKVAADAKARFSSAPVPESPPAPETLSEGAGRSRKGAN